MDFTKMTDIYVLFRGIFDAFIHFVKKVLGIVNDDEEADTTVA